MNYYSFKINSNQYKINEFYSKKSITIHEERRCNTK